MRKLKFILITFSLFLLTLGGASLAEPCFFVETPKDNDFVVETISPDQRDEDDDEEITEYEYRTTDDYLSELNYPTSIKDIAKTSITGLGTNVSPYIVNSTADLIFLTKQSLSNKYIELNCDIVFNDEHFDPESGEPSGGDGVIYKNAQACYTWTNNSLNGNGFSLIGQYGYGLVAGGVKHKEYRNIKIENACLSVGSFGAALGGDVERMINCSFLSGRVVALSTDGSRNYIAGLCRIVTYAENCVNYATIVGDSDTGGLFSALSGSGGVIKNCVNYGDVHGYRGAGGIVGYVLGYDNVILENCANYGDVCLEGSNQAGGIIGRIKNSTVMLNGCKNYGTVSATQLTGGLVGYIVSKTVDFYNCENYGNITSDFVYACGSFVGAVQDSEDGNEVLTIKNCKNIQSKNTPLFGRSITKIQINITNCYIEIDTKDSESCHLLFKQFHLAELNVSGLHARVKTNSKTINLVDGSSAYTGNTSKITNVYVEIIGTSYVFGTGFINTLGVNKEVDGIIISVNGVGSGYYYGSCFSGFNISWKTGLIGLNALTGKGQFSGPVDEEMLLRLGYEKKIQ